MQLYVYRSSYGDTHYSTGTDNMWWGHTLFGGDGQYVVGTHIIWWRQTIEGGDTHYSIGTDNLR